MPKRRLLTIFLLALFLLPTFVYAIDIPGWPIVPCGLSQDNPNTPDIDEHKSCGRCDLFQLLKNTIDFTIGGLMPPVAILLFVWAGFLILLGGANINWYNQGRTIFQNTFWGIVIMLSAWLITNTLILSVGSKYNDAENWWQFTCVETVPAQSPPVQPPPIEPIKYGCNEQGECVRDPDGQYTTPVCNNVCQTPPLETIKYDCNTQNQCVRTPNGRFTSPTCNEFCQPPPAGILSVVTANLSNATVGQLYVGQLEVQGGTQPYRFEVFAGSLPGGLSLNSAGGDIRGTPTTAGTSTFTVKVTDNSTPQQSATKQFSIVVGEGGEVACRFTGVNLCQASNRTPYNSQTMVCSASPCNQYVSAINQYAGRTGVANGANFLKAIMIKESACNAQADSGHAQGLMQLKPSTANIYKSRCGVTADITSQWLKSNPELSICIAAEYMKALTQTSCGSTPRGVAAGYNGGSGACAKSRDCSGETSCAGGPVQRWECLYDNTQHTVCNDSRPNNYDETRDYAIKVLYCYNNPGF